MVDLLTSLKDTPLPTLLILAGLFFLLLSVVAKLGGAIEVNPSQQKLAMAIGLFLLVIGLVVTLKPSGVGPLGTGVKRSAGQDPASECRSFLALGRTLNWKILDQSGIVNAGTFEIISLNESTGQFEVEQITQTKANKKVFLKGSFDRTIIAFNRGDAEKWLGECKPDRMVGKVKTSYGKDMDFEIQ